ncbi:MAG: hypothetical protein ACRDUY_10605, partial [Nitriliruptorales bacterium]
MDRRQEGVGDRLHHRPGREREPALLEEPHHPQLTLQLRYVQVEIIRSIDSTSNVTCPSSTSAAVRAAV